MTIHGLDNDKQSCQREDCQGNSKREARCVAGVYVDGPPVESQWGSVVVDHLFGGGSILVQRTESCKLYQ